MPELPNPSILASHLCAAVHNEQTRAPLANGTLVVLDVPANTANLSVLRVQVTVLSPSHHRRVSIARCRCSASPSASATRWTTRSSPSRSVGLAKRSPAGDAARRISPEVADAKKARAKLAGETHRAKEALSTTNNTTVLPREHSHADHHRVAVRRPRLFALGDASAIRHADARRH